MLSTDEKGLLLLLVVVVDVLFNSKNYVHSYCSSVQWYSSVILTRVSKHGCPKLGTFAQIEHHCEHTHS